MLLNGNAKLKTKVMLFIKFSCVAAYQRLNPRDGCKHSPSLVSVAWRCLGIHKKDLGFTSWSCLSGDTPDPCDSRQAYTDVPLRSLRMPHPTTAHSPLTPLHFTYPSLESPIQFQNGWGKERNSRTRFLNLYWEELLTRSVQSLRSKIFLPLLGSRFLIATSQICLTKLFKQSRLAKTRVF